MGLREMGLPERIGRYEIVADLASGGMAEILLARLVGPNGFERPIVIKRILPHLAREATFRDMFLDEARIVAGIRHPNVVQVQELGQEDAELFLAMEYLEGESASGLLKRLVASGERLPPELAAHIISQSCAGLHAAHELKDSDGAPVNLVHRDVSPQNLFITYDGQVKVLDFGIAKAADRITRTETGVVKGKHEYMSPEHCLGKPLDRRSDIFALGVVFFELLTGRRLFKRGSHMATFNAICTEPIPQLKDIAPWVDLRLEPTVQKALARKRADRFATALDMRRELLAILHVIGEGRDLDESLAKLMARVFTERMDEKREMLRRVRAGSALTHIPPGEVDLSVEIPVVTPHTGFEAHQPTTASRWEQRVGGESRLPGARRGIALVALAVVGIGAGVFGLRAQHQSPAAPVGAGSASTSGPVPSAAEAPVTAPSAMPPATAAASPVILHIETRPAAAHVFFQGADRGASPVDLSIDRGKSPVGLELRAQGFTTLTETVVPDMDQRLVLTLSPATVAVRHPSPPSPKPPPPPAAATTHPAAPAASEAGGFHRFE